MEEKDKEKQQEKVFKIVDPVRLIEELKKRDENNYDGKVILRFKPGRGIISIREEYDIEIKPLMNEKDIAKYYGDLMRWHIYGKTHMSLHCGNIMKFTIEKQISLDKFFM